MKRSLKLPVHRCRMLLCIALCAGLVTPAGTHAHEADTRSRHAAEDHADDEVSTTIPAPVAMAAGITTAIAGAETLNQTLMLYGRIAPAADGVFQVAAAFPGILQSVAVQVGDRVVAGDTLAMVRGSDSLQTYAVRAPAAGVVLERHLNAGAAVGEGPLLTLADLSRVWSLVTAFPSDLIRIELGQPALVNALHTGQNTAARIDYIAPVMTAGQGVQIRLAIDNSAGHWRPGQMVTARVVIATDPIPLAVRASALQTVEQRSVVFTRDGDSYEMRTVETGRSDGRFVEIITGLDVGSEYVVDNSFLVKADILKSGASHAH